MTISEEAKKILEEEEKTLKSVLSSLRSQMERGTGRLQLETKRARELTSNLVAATSDEDKQLLASDEAVSHALAHQKNDELKSISTLLKKPYFARLVVEEEINGRPKNFEYKIGLVGNTDCRIIDWRKAPIAKLYYEYKEGDEYCELIQNRERTGTVVLRNSIEIKDGTLKKVSCKHGTFIRSNSEWQCSSSGIRGLIDRKNGALPDVLSLITAEQFQAITTDAETAVLIQGVAGSGKTTVALHRLAFLLHEDNSEFSPGECLVVVLSPVLKAYIKNSLPHLGVEDVRVLTYPELMHETLKNETPEFFTEDGDIARASNIPPHRITRLKRSMALLSALEAKVHLATESNSKSLATELNLSSLPSGIVKIYESLQARKASEKEIAKELSLAIERGVSNVAPHSELYAPLQRAQSILKTHSAGSKSLGETLLEVLSDPQAIIDLDESNLIDRDLVEEAYIRTKQNLEERVLDAGDDALLYRLVQLRSGGIRLKNGSYGRYRSLTVDEVQDFSPVDLAGIIGSIESVQHLTLVGDTSQQLDPTADFPGWEKLKKHWSFKSDVSSYVSLAVSHRSSLPIMKLGDFVKGRNDVTEGREGRVPLWFRGNTETFGISSAISWLTKALERYPDVMTCVICSTKEEARQALSLLSPTFGSAVRAGDDHSFSFEEGIVVASIQQIKGLEFTNVLLWNPSAKDFPKTDPARNALYVAITRAEENLCITTWGRPTSLLPQTSRGLVRLVEEEIEEED